jgi:hypothetical protein
MEILRTDIDWAAKYRLRSQRSTTRTQLDDTNDNTTEEEDNNSDSESITNLIAPPPAIMTESERKSTEQFVKMIHCEECTPIGLNVIPFPLNKKSKTCQVCHYEMKNTKWEGVVFCTNHGVRLCTESSPPRKEVEPKLYKLDGTAVTDYSWTCPEEGSCWAKFHKFYVLHGLFNKKQIDVSNKKLKFGAPVYTSQLYQRKYAALGIEVVKKKGRATGMGKIVQKQHIRFNKN